MIRVGPLRTHGLGVCAPARPGRRRADDSAPQSVERHRPSAVPAKSMRLVTTAPGWPELGGAATSATVPGAPG